MRCRYCDTEMDVITVFDAEAKPLKMYECPTCGATLMGELTVAHKASKSDEWEG